MNVSLLTPTTDLQEEYLDFYNEWKDSGETMIPWVISKNPANFPAMAVTLVMAFALLKEEKVMLRSY